jgi:hypothetical protein
MMQPDKVQIADRSYFIWENEGRPEGKALEHWLRAQEELAAETAPDTNSAKPKRARATSVEKPKRTVRARKPKAS